MPRPRLLVAGLLILAAPAHGNFLVEPTFEQILQRADLVVIGTVTETRKGGRRGVGSAATVSVLRTIKGDAPPVLEVSNYSRIAEADPRCCDRGATYMMFLGGSKTGPYVSVWGAYGIRRLGGPEGAITVIPGGQFAPGRRNR